MTEPVKCVGCNARREALKRMWMQDEMKLELGCVLLAVCKMRLQRELLPIDSRRFAEVVNELGENGNGFARAFDTYPGVAGRTCPGFEAGMRMTIFAGLSCWQGRLLRGLCSMRWASQTLAGRADAEDAHEVLVKYLERVEGVRP
jgi:hypothetical protein